ncbi:hypothetical protein Avbf_07055 [Armadillidium vulgare]|nr:hypothetical protein Avbf_07055 [Armadillidium vulgare]
MDTPKKLMLQIYPLNRALCVFQGAHSYLQKRQRRSFDLSKRELGTFAGAKGYEKETKTILKHPGWHLTCK